jgi:hypothetical protein
VEEYDGSGLYFVLNVMNCRIYLVMDAIFLGNTNDGVYDAWLQ